MLRAAFPAFSLPTDAHRLSLLLLLSALDCSARQQGALLGFGGGASAEVDVFLDCPTQRLLLTSPGTAGSVSYQLPAASATDGSSLALLLTQDPPSGGFAACANGRQLTPRSGSSAALLQQLAGAGDGSASGGGLLGPAVVIGARLDTALSARADLAAVFVSDGILPCNRTLTGQPLQELRQELAAAAAQQAAPPTVAVQHQPAGDAVVGEPVSLAVTATPSGGALGHAHRIRLTFFGLAPEGCTAAECGDRVVEAAGAAPPGQPAALAASATFAKPGRYIVRIEVRGCLYWMAGRLLDGCGHASSRPDLTLRLQVTSMQGHTATHDHALLVRKQGDSKGAAPCCRHSAVPVAQQLGRPISDTVYRDGTAAQQAAALGWSDDYWQVGPAAAAAAAAADSAVRCPGAASARAA